MDRIISKYIGAESHPFVGTTWQFRGCQVEMHKDGFSCSCKKKHREKCKHIRSVELGILGVNAKEYLIEPVCAL
jgi:hypothetical protein